MIRSLQSSLGVVLLLLGALGIWSDALTLSSFAVDRFPRSEQWAFAVIVAVLAPLLVALVHRIANGAADAQRANIFRSFAFGALCFAIPFALALGAGRSEEHTSELQSLMRISYAVSCLKKK